MKSCAKKIFIAAIQLNDGKTTVALGLILNLKERIKDIGFIKPIGQRYLIEEGFKIDEDSVLIEQVCELCGVKCGIKDMSPVAVERGFTERYILEPQKDKITSHIKESFERIAADRQLVVIEGTGHAGVGSVFDHSNATVAKLLGSKVILISSGGIGRPIDEIILNKSLFDAAAVELLGVIINKVIPEKFDKVNRIIRKGLERKGIAVLGALPYYPFLCSPTIAQIVEETGFEVIAGKSQESINNHVENIIVGAMQPHDAINYIKPNSLIITPGDREDIITMALSLHLGRLKTDRLDISGFILTGGIRPHPTIVGLIDQANIPLLLARSDTYSVASKVHDLTVKLRPADSDKIERIVKMVKDYVDIDRILDSI
jgi:hypothetical protein